LGVYFITEGGTIGNEIGVTENPRGVGPRPVGADVNSDIAVFFVKSVAKTGGFGVGIDLTIGRMLNLKFVTFGDISFDKRGRSG